MYDNDMIIFELYALKIKSFSTTTLLVLILYIVLERNYRFRISFVIILFSVSKLLVKHIKTSN